ncbi:uncharacterized protein LOC126833209 isoform X2 [Adelges cooleyi]|uniref:uncharacterized protein LOC126833209 isoform X2 n=1 Tax=Adelges cooleyi TaxID=133065 RepID=UPI00217F61E3|nr:uncharacterized protein LOC126833209 isoform X2 [Adelges cooleyi]
MGDRQFVLSPDRYSWIKNDQRGVQLQQHSTRNSFSPTAFPLSYEMNEEPAVAEKFGPAVLTVSENIRKQADDLFKPSEINANDLFNLADTKVSWIIQNGYQQYLESIPANVLEKNEREVLFPWTQWNTSTGTHHRPSPSVNASPVSVDQFLFQSTPSPPQQYGRSVFSTSLPATRLQFSPYSCGSGQASNNLTVLSSNDSMAADASLSSTNNSIGDLMPLACSTSSSSSSSSLFSFQNSSGGGGGLSYSGENRMLFNASVPPPNMESCSNTPPPYLSQTLTSSRSADYSPASNSPRWTSRLYYYRVNSDSMVNKLVEHYCTFCYKNHEPPEVYGSHLVRDATRTTCPKLRALRCKHCNGTGDNAHTLKYCPFYYANYS